MADCACSSFPSSLGNVTIGAALGVGTSPQPRFRLEVNGDSRIVGSDQFPLRLRGGSAVHTHASVVEFEAPNTTAIWRLGAGGYTGTQQEFSLYDVPNAAYRWYAGPTGNVGIGTAMPRAKLHVQGGRTRLRGTDQITLALDPPPTGDTNTSAVQFNDSAGNARWQLVSGLGNAPGNFARVNVGGGDATPLYVNAAGYVGIGTVTPASKLDTVGTIRATAEAVPSSGDGLELLYAAPRGVVQARSRPSGTFRRLDIDGAPLLLNLSAPSNVGIGLDSPMAQLHVNGNSIVEEDLTVKSSIRAGTPDRKIADGSGCYYAERHTHQCRAIDVLQGAAHE